MRDTKISDFLIYAIIITAFTVGVFWGGEKIFKEIEAELIAHVNANILTVLTQEKRATAPSTLVFVGDIMIADNRGTGILMERFNDPNYPFLKIVDTVRNADLAFGNLEGPIAAEGRGYKAGSRYSFRMEPQVVSGLLFAGFDVLSLANNHMWDYGQVALEDTVDILTNNGIAPVGAGKNSEEANAPVIKNVNGTKVAFLAYVTLFNESGTGHSYTAARENASGLSRFNTEEITRTIKDLKTSGAADIVVTSFHWGTEYIPRSNEHQQNVARAMVDAGADLVIGHHPHVAQEIEKYNNGWIAYSLGNFVFDQNFSKETMKGLMVRAIIEDKKVTNFEPIPIELTPTYQPYIP